MSFPNSVGNLSVAPLWQNNNLSDLPSPQIAFGNMGTYGSAVYVPSSSGFTYTVPNGQTLTVLAPSGAVTGCTLLLPQAPLSGVAYEFFATQAIATVVVSGQGGIASGGATLTAMAQNTKYSFAIAGSGWWRLT